VDVVGHEKQPGIFEPAGRQYVEACTDDEFAPRPSRGPDVVDGSSGGFYLDVQSVSPDENPQKRGLPEFGFIAPREIRGRAPALET